MPAEVIQFAEHTELGIILAIAPNIKFVEHQASTYSLGDNTLVMEPILK